MTELPTYRGRPLVMALVAWHDAHAISDGWTSAEGLIPGACEVTTVGFVLPDAKPGHITLAQTVGETPEYFHVFSIPDAMVIRVERLVASPLIPLEPEP